MKKHLLSSMLIVLAAATTFTGCTINVQPPPAATAAKGVSEKPADSAPSTSPSGEDLGKAADAIQEARRNYDSSAKDEASIQRSLAILGAAQQYDPKDRVLSEARYFYYRQLILAELETENSRRAAAAEAAAGAAAVGGTAAVAAAGDDSPAAATSTLGGRIEAHGSDTMRKIMLTSADKFRKTHPGVMFHVESKGSGSAPKAMIEGVADIGCMSRRMKDSEIDALVEKFGQKPIHIIVGVDALAVFVHKENPIKGLNLVQLDQIFSEQRLQGGKTQITSWGELGLDGDWAARDIFACGRNMASGTYGVFKKIALKKGEYGEHYQPQEDSEAVISLCASRKEAIGYSGIGYKTKYVRAVPIAYNGDDYVEPTFENAMNGSYAFGRTLNIYVMKTPEKPIRPEVKAFLEYILSDEGQAIVVSEGYGAIPEGRRKQILQSL